MNLRSQWIWKNSSCGLYGIAEISSFRTSDPVKFLLFINEASDTSTVKYRFELKIEEKCYLVEYEIGLLKNGKKSFCISKEKFSQREMSEGKRITPVFDY